MKESLIGKITTAAILGLALSVTSGQADQLDYSSTPGSDINFTGHNTFNFTPASDSFQITSGTAAGFQGEMTGTYTIGAISTVGIISSASVTGSGLFEISDGVDILSANLSWVDITQLGTGGVLNTVGNVNLTDITYGGTNPDLLALADANAGIDVLTFQFVPAVSLVSLADSHHDTSFSGSIAAVAPPPSPSPDQGATMTLLGGAFLALGALRRKTS